jgi:hypothetical protein
MRVLRVGDPLLLGRPDLPRPIPSRRPAIDAVYRAARTARCDHGSDGRDVLHAEAAGAAIPDRSSKDLIVAVAIDVPGLVWLA